MNGYILIHRKLQKWQWYKDSNTLHLFIDLLLDANYEESKFGFQVIERGQCLTSLKRIQENTGLTYQQIRTSLDKLQKSGEINKQTTNRYSIITINNYDEYQDINKQITNKQQTDNNIKKNIYNTINNNINTINNNINNKNKEKIIKRKKKYGSFENVSLTDEEYQKLKEKFKDYEDKIENLSGYIASKGDKYKSHYATILNWARKEKGNQNNLPEWWDKTYERKEPTDEERKELEELIRGY